MWMITLVFSNDADSEYLAYEENSKWRVNVIRTYYSNFRLRATRSFIVGESTMKVLDTFDNYLNTEV